MGKSACISQINGLLASEIEGWTPEKLRREASIYRSEADEAEQDGFEEMARILRNRASALDRVADSREQ